MKARKGFVSNSSSSSFIVAFDGKPQTMEEMKGLLFGEQEGEYHDPYDECSWTYDEVAYTVLLDLLDSDPLTREQVLEQLSRGCLPGQPDMDDFKKKDAGGKPEWDWDAYEEARKQHAKRYHDRFLKENRGKTFYRFNYGDDSGPYYSALEHGELFSRLPHVRISLH
jgi:hypothetical protein